MLGQGSGLFLRYLDRDRESRAGAWNLASRIRQRIAHACMEVDVSTKVTSIFVAIVLLLAATTYVSSSPRLEDALTLTPLQGAELLVPDTHFTYYQAHLADLGIDRLNCK